MLRFVRNKIVGIELKDEDILIAHGFLDDDIYSLEIDISIRMNDLRIVSVEGRWNRWTTPECPRAISLLQGAVELCLTEKDFDQQIHKLVGRKACRHFANLILECSDSVKEALALSGREGWRPAKEEQSLKKEENGASVEDKTSFFIRDQEARYEDQSQRRLVGKFIDLHVHTYPASPCSSAPVDDLVYEAKRIGLDGICLTDHNHVWEPGALEELRQKHGFLILGGNEITTDQGDILVFGFRKDIKGIIKLEELREEVLAAGGYMIVAHPFRGFLVFGIGQLEIGVEQGMQRPLFGFVDAVEILNSKVTEKENQLASDVAQALGLPVTAGSDAHGVQEVGIYATWFPGSIRGERDLVEALREGNCEPVAYRKNRTTQGKEG